MRDPSRIPLILDAVRSAWEKYPDLRLGQLLVNAAVPKDRCPELFFMEDQALLDAMSRFESLLAGKPLSKAE